MSRTPNWFIQRHFAVFGAISFPFCVNAWVLLNSSFVTKHRIYRLFGRPKCIEIENGSWSSGWCVPKANLLYLVIFFFYLLWINVTVHFNQLWLHDYTKSFAIVKNSIRFTLPFVGLVVRSLQWLLTAMFEIYMCHCNSFSIPQTRKKQPRCFIFVI